MEEAIVRFSHITMEFPGIRANDDVSLDINRGEIFALVGENGAGKSTLMNVLYGINEPTAGELFIKGERITAFNPREAIEKGVGMVHQHFMLVPSFTAAENIVMSREPRKFKFFSDKRAAIRETKRLSDEYGLSVDPEAKIADLGVGTQQRVEILKTLYRGADILILDEPTAVLTPSETDELFAVLRKMVRERNMTVIIITHKLYEVMAISDRVGVMRKGKLVDVKNTSEVDERILASLMVGRPVLFDKLLKTGEPGEKLVEISSLKVKDNRGLTAVDDVSLYVREGEILGIAAIEGNGQSELLEAVTGMRKTEAGTILICGTEVQNKTPGDIRNTGLAHIPEDRILTGISREASVAENLITGKHNEKEFNRHGIYFDEKAVNSYASELYEKYDIRGAGTDVAVGSMSGGNMQKVVVAREFSLPARVLIVSQPTRGVDVGAIEFIHTKIVEKRNEGAAVLLCSADLDEVFRLSDRIITMYEGKITGEFEAAGADREQIGYYMTGHRDGGGNNEK